MYSNSPSEHRTLTRHIIGREIRGVRLAQTPSSKGPHILVKRFESWFFQ